MDLNRILSAISNKSDLDISSNLKKQAKEKLEKMNKPKSTVSQYTPKKGESERLDREKLQRIEEESKLLNMFANSKASGNLQDAMFFASDVLGGVEGVSALKAILKKSPKFALSKAAKTVTEDKIDNRIKDAVASTIVNNNTGRTQYFDKNGNELFSISQRRSIPNPDYTDMGNSYLKNNNPFIPSNRSTLGDIPIYGGSTTKFPKK